MEIAELIANARIKLTIVKKGKVSTEIINFSITKKKITNKKRNYFRVYAKKKLDQDDMTRITHWFPQDKKK